MTPEDLLRHLAAPRDDTASFLAPLASSRNVSFSDNVTYRDVVQNETVSPNTDARRTNIQGQTDGDVSTNSGNNVSTSRDSSSSVASTHTIQKLEQTITNLKREFAQVMNEVNNHSYGSPTRNKLIQTSRALVE